MVGAPPKLELRVVGSDHFDDIYPLLLTFENPKMSRDDWYRMLFAYAWWQGPERGFALYDGGVAVGFLGTIFSTRHIAGRDELFCNASCWVVRPEYRSASMLLLKALLDLKQCTLVNLTPTPRSYEIFRKLGFLQLESERFLLPPGGNPTRLVGATITSDPGAFAAKLAAHERAIERDLVACPTAKRVLLGRGGRTCYVVATLRLVKGVRFAELQYVGDPEFFWDNRVLAHAAFFREMGAVGLAVDARFARRHRLGIAWRRPAPRAYRPAHAGIVPEAVDGLFSELMVLKI